MMLIVFLFLFFFVFACAEKERSSDDAPDEHHVVPACLPAMMMMNHQISGFEIIIPKNFVVM